MMGWLAHILYQAAWCFYALGPQLAICMALGYGIARRSGGSRVDWLVGAFGAALVPFVGVVVMYILWRRARREPTRRAAAHDPRSPAGTAS